MKNGGKVSASFYEFLAGYFLYNVVIMESIVVARGAGPDARPATGVAAMRVVIRTGSSGTLE
jgi:hypothetical protein